MICVTLHAVISKKIKSGIQSAIILIAVFVKISQNKGLNLVDTAHYDLRLTVVLIEGAGKEHFRLVDHDIFLYDFHLTDSASARGIAAQEYTALVKYDLDGVERSADTADAGCYQFVETAF